MAYEDVKRLLTLARTFSERTEAVKAALAAGMPLWEIEEYLDWLDQAGFEDPADAGLAEKPRPPRREAHQQDQRSDDHRTWQE